MGGGMENDIWHVPASVEELSGKVAPLGPPQAEFAIDNARFIKQVIGAVLMVPLGLLLLAVPFAIMWVKAGGHEWLLCFKLAVIGFIFLSGSAFVAQRA